VRAIRYDHHGGPEVLRSADVAEPAPGPRDVVVAVRAAGINRFDAILRAGPTMPGQVLPCVPGMDASGEVVAVGPAVEHLAVGARVVGRPHDHCGECPACVTGHHERCRRGRFLGYSVPGSYAERVVISAAHVFELPSRVSWSAAAAIPTTLSTAWRALVLTADLRMGETLLVHGAGSGVTTMCIQLARHLGARVIVTSRSASMLGLASALGADEAIDSSDGDVAAAVREATGGRGADVVFDHVGASRFATSLAAVADEGRVVLGGSVSGDAVELRLDSLYRRGVAVAGIKSQSYTGFRDMLSTFWATGIEPVVADQLPLERAADGHRRLEAGGVFGKLLLIP